MLLSTSDSTVLHSFLSCQDEILKSSLYTVKYQIPEVREEINPWTPLIKHSVVISAPTAYTELQLIFSKIT